MDEAELRELRREWLIANAVICFLGGLIVLQAWDAAAPATYQWPGGLPMPTFPDPFALTAATVLLCASVVMAVASMVTRFRARVVQAAFRFAPGLAGFAWVMFGISWLALMQELPGDSWWTATLAWTGGIAWVFLLVKVLVEFVRMADRHRARQAITTGEGD